MERRMETRVRLNRRRSTDSQRYTFEGPQDAFTGAMRAFAFALQELSATPQAHNLSRALRF